MSANQQWYVRTSKADRGPYSNEKLRRLAEAGKVKPDTLVSRDGEKWIKAEQIRGLEFAKRGRRRKPAPAGEPEPETHVPWYEGSSSANKARAYADMDAAGLRESMPSNAAYFVDRLKYSGTLAVVATGLAYGIVRLCYVFGAIKVTTTTSTLAWRIGLPGAVFVVVFALLFWLTGRSGPGGPITDDMSDEEIARML